MNNLLYYPTYTPSTRQLRSLLLYYDQITTIVPEVDQRHVEEREHIHEIKEIDGKLIKFVDPQYNRRNWIDMLDANSSFMKLIHQCSGYDEVLPDSKNLRFRAGRLVGNMKEQETIVSSLMNKGWNLVAAEKLPEELKDNMCRHKVALPLFTFRNPKTGAIVETNPILMPSQLAEYIVSRIAREISKDIGVSTFSFDDLSFANHVFDPNSRDARNLLFSLLLPLSIPADIENLEPEKFFEVRHKTAEVRRSIQLDLRDLLTETGIDSESSATGMISRANDVIELINDRVKSAQRAIATRESLESISFGVNLLFALTGTYVGSSIGDTSGALIGTALGFATSGLVGDIPSFAPPMDRNPLINSLACARGEIARKQPNEIQVPSYML